MYNKHDYGSMIEHYIISDIGLIKNIEYMFDKTIKT